jgi:hypothetical protein
MTLCAGNLETPFLVEKILSGGGIKVTKGAWQVPKWLTFVVSQVVLQQHGTRGGLVPTNTTG